MLGRKDARFFRKVCRDLWPGGAVPPGGDHLIGHGRLVEEAALVVDQLRAGRDWAGLFLLRLLADLVTGACYAAAR